MSLLTDKVEILEIGGGQFRQTIRQKPIAVWENGTLLAMQTDFADSGDGTTPHIVNRAPLRSRVANDGMRRLFPIPGDDSSYLEIGAPFVKVGGVWTQVGLGTPSRSAHVITWTRPQTITRVIHFGHGVKLDIELRGGFVPEDSMIAFPVGLNGLSRSGTQILKDGVPVMQLRPFVMEDASNELDRRPITHQFVNLGGNPYLLLTLPSLVGMARPRIDPTLSLQPDGTAGLDTIISVANATTNYGTITTLNVGEGSGGSSGAWRVPIKFDVSTIPGTATVDSAIKSLFMTSRAGGTSRTYRVFRLKRAWVETEATWNIYSTGNNWSTAGGFHTDDCEQTDIGSRLFDGVEALNVFADFTLTASKVQEWVSGAFANNGVLVKADTEANDLHTFSSSDNATAANRPKFVVVYTEAGGGGVPRHFMHYQRMGAT